MKARDKNRRLKESDVCQAKGSGKANKLLLIRKLCCKNSIVLFLFFLGTIAPNIAGKAEEKNFSPCWVFPQSSDIYLLKKRAIYPGLLSSWKVKKKLSV